MYANADGQRVRAEKRGFDKKLQRVVHLAGAVLLARCKCIQVGEMMGWFAGIYTRRQRQRRERERGCARIFDEISEIIGYSAALSVQQPPLHCGVSGNVKLFSSRSAGNSSASLPCCAQFAGSAGFFSPRAKHFSRN